MTNRGGIYEGPDGEPLHGDGRPVVSAPISIRAEIVEIVGRIRRGAFTGSGRTEDRAWDELNVVLDRLFDTSRGVHPPTEEGA